MKTYTLGEALRENWKSLIPDVLGAILLCLAGWGLTIMIFCLGGPH
jgi:hypothetical protein